MHRQLQEEHIKDTTEATQEIAELKKAVNEAEVDAKLSIQYLERHIEGAQSCRDRLHLKEQSKLQAEIDRLKKLLDTEKLVHQTIKQHLMKKNAELQDFQNDRDRLRDQRTEQLEQEKAEVRQKKDEDAEKMEEITEKMLKEDELTRLWEDQQREEMEQEEAKLREKMQMEDAARFVQRKWNWFQKEGKYLAKKKKKGRKGKKKK